MSLQTPITKRNKSSEEQKTAPEKITNDAIVVFLKTIIDNFKTLESYIEEKSRHIIQDFEININSLFDKNSITFSVNVAKNVDGTFKQTIYFTNGKNQRQLINVTTYTFDNNNNNNNNISLPVYKNVLEILESKIRQQEFCSQFDIDFFCL